MNKAACETIMTELRTLFTGEDFGDQNDPGRADRGADRSKQEQNIAIEKHFAKLPL